MWNVWKHSEHGYLNGGAAEFGMGDRGAIGVEVLAPSRSTSLDVTVSMRCNCEHKRQHNMLYCMTSYYQLSILILSLTLLTFYFSILRLPCRKLKVRHTDCVRGSVHNGDRGDSRGIDKISKSINIIRSIQQSKLVTTRYMWRFNIYL